MREGQLSPAACGEGAGAGGQRDGFGGAQRRVVQAAEERGQLRADLGDLGQDRLHLGRVAADCGSTAKEALGGRQVMRSKGLAASSPSSAA